MELSPFESLANHDIRKLIQKSLASPNDQPLRIYLLKGLWDQARFKDFYDLLPELSEPNLAETLKVQTKALLRQVFSEKGSLKKLVSVAISYSNFLVEHERKALLGLLEKMIGQNNSESVKKYYQYLTEINTELRRIQLSSDLGGDLSSDLNSKVVVDPKLLLSPDLAAKLSLTAPIAEALIKAGCTLAVFYEPGGHLRLLAASGYWQEVDFKKLKSLNPLLCFRLEVQQCLEKAPKELSLCIKPYRELLLSQKQYQEIFTEVFTNPLIKFKEIPEDSELFIPCLNSNAKFLTEVSKFFDDFCEKLPSLIIDIDLARISYLNYLLQYQMGNQSAREVSTTLFKINDLITTNFKAYSSTMLWPGIKVLLENVQSCLVIYLICNSLVEKLTKLIKDENSDFVRQILIKTADEFKDRDWDFAFYQPSDLRMCEVLLKALEELPLQKTRIKKLKTLEKKIRSQLV